MSKSKLFIIIGIIMSLLVTMLVIPACKATTTETTTAETTSAETTASGEKVTLNVWWWETAPSWVTLADFAEKNFEAAHPNVDVVWTSQDYSTYFASIDTAIAGGKGPDVFNLQPGGDIYRFRDAKQIIALDEIIKNDPEWSSWLTKAFDYPDWYTDDGHFYGTQRDCATLQVFYWKDLYPNGFPKTLDEMYAEADRLNSEGIVPLSVGWKDKWSINDTFVTFVDQLDPTKQMIRDADKGKISWVNDTFKQAMQYVKDLYDKKVFAEDALALTYGTEAFEAFASKKAAAMWPMGEWFLSGLKDEDVVQNDNIGVSLLPAIDAGKEVPILGGSGSLLAVAAYSKHQDIALEFIKYWNSPENQGKEFDLYITSPMAGDLGKTSPNHVFNELIEFGKQKPTYRYVDTPELYNGVGDEITLVLLGTKSIDEALASLQAISDKVYKK